MTKKLKKTPFFEKKFFLNFEKNSKKKSFGKKKARSGRMGVRLTNQQTDRQIDGTRLRISWNNFSAFPS